MNDLVQLDFHDRVARLTMDDGKANAYGPDMIAAISAGLDRAVEEADVTVIAGRPGVFCAGFDLRIIRGDDHDAIDAMRSAGAALLLKAYLHPQPLVLLCTGHALAAGALLLLTGDYRIGLGGEFQVGLNETSIGLSLPAFGLELARDRLDPRRLSDATVGARVFDPAGAAEVGYLDQAVAEDELNRAADEVVQRMAALDTAAFAETKARLRQGTVDRIRAASA